MQQITAAGGLTLGSSTSGDITIDGVLETKSQDIQTVTLLATRTSKTVTFDTAPSTFHTLVVQADGGINTAFSVFATAGLLSMDADADDGGSSTLTIEDGKTLFYN